MTSASATVSFRTLVATMLHLVLLMASPCAVWSDDLPTKIDSFDCDALHAPPACNCMTNQFLTRNKSVCKNAGGISDLFGETWVDEVSGNSSDAAAAIDKHFSEASVVNAAPTATIMVEDASTEISKTTFYSIGEGWADMLLVDVREALASYEEECINANRCLPSRLEDHNGLYPHHTTFTFARTYPMGVLEDLILYCTKTTGSELECLALIQTTAYFEVPTSEPVRSVNALWGNLSDGSKYYELALLPTTRAFGNFKILTPFPMALALPSASLDAAHEMSTAGNCTSLADELLVSQPSMLSDSAIPNQDEQEIPDQHFQDEITFTVVVIIVPAEDEYIDVDADYENHTITLALDRNDWFAMYEDESFPEVTFAKGSELPEVTQDSHFLHEVFLQAFQAAENALSSDDGFEEGGLLFLLFEGGEEVDEESIELVNEKMDDSLVSLPLTRAFQTPEAPFPTQDAAFAAVVAVPTTMSLSYTGNSTSPSSGLMTALVPISSPTPPPAAFPRLSVHSEPSAWCVCGVTPYAAGEEKKVIWNTTVAGTLHMSPTDETGGAKETKEAAAVTDWGVVVDNTTDAAIEEEGDTDKSTGIPLKEPGVCTDLDYFLVMFVCFGLPLGTALILGAIGGFMVLFPNQIVWVLVRIL